MAGATETVAETRTEASTEANSDANTGTSTAPEAQGGLELVQTPYGNVRVDPNDVLLGELLVTEEGAELEVVGLEPLRFELAPEEAEDWGE